MKFQLNNAILSILSIRICRPGALTGRLLRRARVPGLTSDPSSFLYLSHLPLLTTYNLRSKATPAP